MLRAVSEKQMKVRLRRRLGPRHQLVWPFVADHMRAVLQHFFMMRLLCEKENDMRRSESSDLSRPEFVVQPISQERNETASSHSWEVLIDQKRVVFAVYLFFISPKY